MPTPARKDRSLQILVLVCLGQFMLLVDDTIVNVALPSIQADLGFSESGLTWVANAYFLAFGGFLLLGGKAAGSARPPARARVRARGLRDGVRDLRPGPELRRPRRGPRRRRVSPARSSRPPPCPSCWPRSPAAASARRRWAPGRR